MRTFMLTSACLFILQITNAQTDTIDFEGSLVRIEVDTTYSDNVWQIGRPDKTLFDSAHSIPNVIVTDTVNYYPTENESSFVVGFELTGSQPSIAFTHKFDTDSSHDGGYVEVSFDEGQTWTHLTAETNEYMNAYGFSTWNLYSETDTLQNGKPAFSGTSPDWEQSGILFQCFAVKTSFEFQLRFTFSSDSVQSSHEGWMIDDIVLQDEGLCSGIKEYQNKTCTLKVFPNPFHDCAIINVEDSHFVKNGTFTVFDMFGRTVAIRQKITGNQFTFNQNELTAGIYIYHLIDEKGLSATGRFAVK